MKTVYLGWEKKAVDAVADKLLERGKVWDHLLLVVPTRESGNFLLDRLAEKAGAVMPPLIATTEMLLRASCEDNEYLEDLELWAWATVLCSEGDLEPLVRILPEHRSFQWGIGLAETIIKTQRELAECNFDFNKLLDYPSLPLAERLRWKVLSRLKQSVDRLLGERGVCSLTDCYLKGFDNLLPEHIQEVVLACVPDPIPLVMNKLSELDGMGIISCECWVHAPETIKTDRWGRPLAEQWASGSTDRPEFDMPDFEQVVRIYENPEKMAQGIVRFFEKHKAIAGNSAIGITDDSMIPPVEYAVENGGWPVYLTVGYGASGMGLVKLMGQIRDVMEKPFLWNRWDFLCRSGIVSAALGVEGFHGFVCTLDRAMERYMPDSTEFMQKVLKSGNLEDRAAFDQFEKIYAWVSLWTDGSIGMMAMDLVERLRSNGWGGPYQDVLLNDVYNVAQRLQRLEAGGNGLKAADALVLLCRMSLQLKVYANRDEKVVNMEHWLDLSYDSADCVVLAGMHEGYVPDNKVEDSLLPEGLKKGLKIRSRADRFARDAFLFAGMVESRRKDGVTGIFISRHDSSGNPCIPSSLLFLCNNRDLPGRVKFLFDEADGQELSPAVLKDESGWEWSINGKQESWDVVSPSQLKSFLYCPVRFWLEKIGGFRRLDLSVSSAKAGNAVHYCAELLGPGGEFEGEHSLDALKLALVEKLEEYYTRQYGAVKSLPVLVQMDYAKVKVERMAQEHLKALKEGWEVLAVEDVQKWHPRADVPVTLQMRIDRIERHRETGVLRIVDFKTSAKAKNAQDAHLESLAGNRAGLLAEFLPMLTPVQCQKGKVSRWKDLQLPLYVLAGRELLMARYSATDVIGAYFNLPLTAEDTGYSEWLDLDEDLLASAGEWAVEIVKYLRGVDFVDMPSAEQLGWKLFDDDPYKELSIENIKTMFLKGDGKEVGGL